MVLGVQQIVSYEGDIALGWVLVMCGIVIWTIGLLLAFIRAALYNKSLIEQSVSEKTRSPYLAMILSYIVPGFGQFYVRDSINAIPFLIIFVTVKVLLAGFMASFVIELVGALSASLTLTKLATMESINKNKAMLIIFLFFGTAVFRTGARALVTSDYFNLFGHVGPGRSMEPTLSPHDVILLDSNGKDSIKRGDIVSFDVPSGEAYCKRVVAMAGETVQISNGQLYVNNKKITVPPFDRLYYTTDSSDIFEGGKRSYIVPSGSVFVLGDNSRKSDDSRRFGAVRKEKILDVVYKIIYPFDRIEYLRHNQ